MCVPHTQKVNCDSSKKTVTPSTTVSIKRETKTDTDENSKSRPTEEMCDQKGSQDIDISNDCSLLLAVKRSGSRSASPHLDEKPEPFCRHLGS